MERRQDNLNKQVTHRASFNVGVLKTMNPILKKLAKKIKKKNQKPSYQQQQLPSSNQEISQSLDENIKNIKEALGNSGDVVVREFKMGAPSQQKLAIIFINGLADKDIQGSFIIERLMSNNSENESDKLQSSKQIYTYIKEKILAIGEVEDLNNWKKMLQSLVSGQTLLLVDGSNQIIGCSAQGGELRNITEPTTEPSVRGSKEGFVEALITNTSMVRRRIKSPNLWIKKKKLGKITQTDVAIMYIEGLVNEKLLNEVNERLGKIEVDEVAGANTIEEWINDDIWTPWPMIFTTERPDSVSGNILEGRVAIFVDGTPDCLIFPSTWNQYFQATEDYYLHWNVASFLRLLRMCAFLITLLGPSLFIAFISFHPELIPTPLLVSLTAQRQGIPFPVFIEALLMEFTFEILREAGVRMPRTVGQAVSIVGALVLGEAAVAAGIVSSAMVIVVAGTAIASFTIPHYSMMDATRLLRFMMMILAASFGIYGIGLGVIVLVAHTCSLRSFGIPYLTPYAPFIISDWKDSIIRFPKPFLSKRPRLISQKNVKRSGNTHNLGPSPRTSTMEGNVTKRDSDET
ncbi:spore germination protein [Bacillus sp. 03113]|uniref:spore germination protein n=1 Tax=Bacillus sp. 03113 TaxID=2578211 RepID=UPI00215B96CA|nr:spore germination protein [Bacillus sp. 03113]